MRISRSDFGYQDYLQTHKAGNQTNYAHVNIPLPCNPIIFKSRHEREEAVQKR